VNLRIKAGIARLLHFTAKVKSSKGYARKEIFRKSRENKYLKNSEWAPQFFLWGIIHILMKFCPFSGNNKL